MSIPCTRKARLTGGTKRASKPSPILAPLTNFGACTSTWSGPQPCPKAPRLTSSWRGSSRFGKTQSTPREPQLSSSFPKATLTRFGRILSWPSSESNSRARMKWLASCYQWAAPTSWASGSATASKATSPHRSRTIWFDYWDCLATSRSASPYSSLRTIRGRVGSSQLRIISRNVVVSSLATQQLEEMRQRWLPSRLTPSSEDEWHTETMLSFFDLTESVIQTA